MDVLRFAKGPDGTRGFRTHNTRKQSMPARVAPAARMIKHALGSQRAPAPPVGSYAKAAAVEPADEFDTFFTRAVSLDLLSEATLDGLTDAIACGEQTEAAVLADWKARLGAAAEARAGAQPVGAVDEGPKIPAAEYKVVRGGSRGGSKP